jgi:hypothetical protein
MTRDRAEEYRRRAQELLRLARTISLETARASLIDMAQSWLRLAEEQEQQAEIVPPPDAGQPQAVVQQQQQLQPRDEDDKV